MPTYTFKNTVTGKRDELIMAVSEYKPVMIIEGVKWERDLETDLQATRIEDSDTWNGMESRALAINPSQIREEREYARKRGVDIDFNPKNGNVRFNGRKNRRDYCRLRGAVDYEGEYGDNT
jgi:hypothetical protein